MLLPIQSRKDYYKIAERIRVYILNIFLDIVENTNNLLIVNKKRTKGSRNSARHTNKFISVPVYI